jgi:hypothetical protein
MKIKHIPNIILSIAGYHGGFYREKRRMLNLEGVFVCCIGKDIKHRQNPGNEARYHKGIQ